MTTSSSNSGLSTILSSLGNSSSSYTTGYTSTSGTLISAGQIDVTTLVSELMTVQSQPLVRLQQQQSGIQTKLSAYGKEQSALASLQTAASALALPSAFKASSATVTGSGVSATVSGTPASATYSVAVNNLAQSQSVASAAVASPTATLGTGTLTLQAGTYNATGNTFTAKSGANPITITIDSTNNTLNGIASAINSAANGTVAASVVTDSSGSRLVLSSSNTGAANGFSLTASAGLSQFGFDPTAAAGTQTMTQTQSAMDASFTVNGLALTSASNSVTSAINGLTLNLTQGPATGGAALQSQITVASDPTAITKTVNDFVSAYNSMITLTGSLTSYNAASNTSSVLTGDFTSREVVSTLQSIMGSQSQANGAGSPYSYLVQVGISANSDGTLTLDSTKFQAALAADPASVSALFTTATGASNQQGFAVQVENSVQNLISSTGVLGSIQQGLNSEVKSLTTQEAQLQAELAVTQQRLTQEYSQLNANLSAAQAQQVSLANSLAALPG